MQGLAGISNVEVDIAQIDYKRTSVFSPKRHFLKKYLLNPGFNGRVQNRVPAKILLMPGNSERSISPASEHFASESVALMV
jgi:hypothetical protein